ncbi:MAG: hypothetical protein NW224_17125 [Leptolyngbyaceae cyanobacterium bins.302]|nr:hypothetical protein [Leptolyngbyaceae cyanobacterium bins.302]
MTDRNILALSDLVFHSGSQIEMLQPLSDENLKRVTPSTQEIQIGTEFSNADYLRIARVLDVAPNAVLRRWGLGCNLDFLKYFPNVKRLRLSGGYDSWEPLSLVASHLVDLSIDTYSIGTNMGDLLKDFSQLRKLSFNFHRDGGIKEVPEFDNVFPALALLPNLEVLFFHSVKLPNVDTLGMMLKLRSLSMVQCSIKDLSGVGMAKGLVHLHLGYMMNKNIEFLESNQKLQYLSLAYLSQIETIPSLEKHFDLRRVVLTSMKGLTNLSNIALAPNLEDLILDEEKYLKASDLECFSGHPHLKHVWTNMGSVRKDKAVDELLGLPRLGARSRFDFKFD